MTNGSNLSLISRFQIDEIKRTLLPRRAEILNTITDHSPCSFDFLQRNFVSTPASTMRYDLLQLQKMGLIHKLGVTRGVLYVNTM